MTTRAKAFRRWRPLVSCLVLSCGMMTATGTAVAQYVTPPPDQGIVVDEVGSPDAVKTSSRATDDASSVVPVRPVAQARNTSQSSLPVTGGDVLALASIGVGAVALGTAAILATRRRSTLG